MGVFLSSAALFSFLSAYYAYYTYTHNMQTASQAELVSRGKYNLKMERLET